MSNGNAENFVFPTKTQQQYTPPIDLVKLPSEGKFYPSDHPLYNKKTAEVYYMTTKEEDILVNAAYSKAGIVFDKLIESILVDKTIKSSSLLSGDRDAILYNARINGYGTDYTVTMSCELCFVLNELELDLTKAKNKKVDYSDVDITPAGTIFVDLPVSKMKIELKMLTGVDEKELFDKAASKEKHNLPEQTITERYSQMIKSVAGNDDLIFIRNFISNMPIADSRALRKTYAKYIPGVDFMYKYECSRCEHTNEGGLPITGNFFWPDD